MTPQDGYIEYIVNPMSGASSGKWLVSQFKDYLIENGFDVRVVFTKSLEHACEMATKASVDFDCRLVVGAGGDGTIREILHGLEGTDKPFIPIPCGTENLLANELGFDLHVETLIRAFKGEIRPLDLGTINGRCFTSIVGFGFDGEVVEQVSRERDGHISHMAYFWPIWRVFWAHKFPKMKVVVDGKEFFNDRGLVFIGNISRYAIGLSICKNASFSDGLLDVCIFRCHDQAHLLVHSAQVMFKTHLKSKHILYTQAETIQVESENDDVICQIDGDPGPVPPAEIKVIPKAVRVMVPTGAKPAGMRTRLRRAIG